MGLLVPTSNRAKSTPTPCPKPCTSWTERSRRAGRKWWWWWEGPSEGRGLKNTTTLFLHPSFLLPHTAIPRCGLAAEGRSGETTAVFSGTAAAAGRSLGAFPTHLLPRRFGKSLSTFCIRTFVRVPRLFRRFLGWGWGHDLRVFRDGGGWVRKPELMVAISARSEAPGNERRGQRQPSEGGGRPGLTLLHTVAQQERQDLTGPGPSARGHRGPDLRPGPSAVKYPGPISWIGICGIESHPYVGPSAYKASALQFTALNVKSKNKNKNYVHQKEKKPWKSLITILKFWICCLELRMERCL